MNEEASFEERMKALQKEHVAYLESVKPQIEEAWRVFSDDPSHNTVSKIFPIIHRISGTSATFGFESLSTCAGTLESALADWRDRGGAPYPEELELWDRFVQEILADIPSASS